MEFALVVALVGLAAFFVGRRREGKRLFLFVAVLSVVSVAHATPEIWEAYRTHYNVKGGSDADKASCANCHTQPPTHNDFGKRLKAAMKAQHSRTLTADILTSVEADDSDGDGWSNGDEAKAGFNPGDPKSHPAGDPPRKETTASVKPSATGDSPLIPTHTFHPVLVHFPIALFIFGAFLELFGRYRREDALRNAGYWNLLFGAIATSVAILTGFIAALRLGYALQVGTSVFTHLTLGIVATALMVWVVLWRRNRLLDSGGYWVLLVLAAVAVGLTGHLGGTLVYG